MSQLDPYIVCNEVLATVERALIDAGRRSEDDPAYVAAGLVAWDDCCGLLVALPERIYRSAMFPIEGPDVNGCYDGTLAMQLLVLNMRCVPVIDDQGNAPTIEATDDAYHELLVDAAVVWNTMAYGLPYKGLRLNQTYVGAEGGCIGAESRIVLDLDADAWCW